MKDIFTLSGRTAIVTGGTKGIGTAIAKKLSEAGVSVGIVGRDRERAEIVVKEIMQAGGKAHAFLGDVANEQCCEKIVHDVNGYFGQIDILVNCAGILSSTPIVAVTRKEWDEILATNLTGTFFMTQKVIPFLEGSKAGRIINISSNAGRMGGYENSQCYTASKGGIISITMGIARQLAPSGITVNVVCPGTTETEMAKLYNKETKERLLRRIPMGRLAKPEEVAAAVCFFASEEAGYITGAILDVNGGMYMG